MHLHSQQIRAVRVLYKKKMDDEMKNRFITEMLLLVNLDHPNIIRFLEMFQDKEHYYIVTELCWGGQLLK